MTANPTPTSIAQLLPQHRDLLVVRGIRDDVAAARGYRSIGRAEVRELGFTGNQARPGLLIPLWRVDGECSGYQLRPDKPRITKDGKLIKYETPKGQHNVLDVPPSVRDELHKGQQAILITEGAFKADALATLGIPVINVAGVYGWRGKNKDGGSTALADWEQVSIKGSIFVLAFDSDILTKPEVHQALARLKHFLEGRGAARVRVLMVPPQFSGKVGVDDYIAATSAKAEDLASLVVDELPTAPKKTQEGGHPLPTIIANERQLPAITQEGLAALAAANQPPVLFVRGGKITRPRKDEKGGPLLDPGGEAMMVSYLARAATWVRYARHGNLTECPPPVGVARDLLSVASWPFPPLEGIVEAPVLREDFSILDTAGYDAASRLLYWPAPGLKVPPIPTAPTLAEALAAHRFVQEHLVTDFPWVDTASAANGFASLFSPLLPYKSPAAIIDSPSAGTGKSLWASVISLISTGRAAISSCPKDDEEWRKAITSILLQGNRMVIVDNVDGRIASPDLARALTGLTWDDRALGRNEMVHVPSKAVWVLTGNNIALGGDLPRRSYLVRLDAKLARPWLRTGFLHPDLQGWVLEHRGKLLAALLTILRAWHVAGRPEGQAPLLGNFGAWCKTVGGVLAFRGVEGFLENLPQVYEQLDGDILQWDVFFLAWWSELQDKP